MKVIEAYYQVTVIDEDVASPTKTMWESASAITTVAHRCRSWPTWPVLV